MFDIESEDLVVGDPLAITEIPDCCKNCNYLDEDACTYCYKDYIENHPSNL